MAKKPVSKKKTTKENGDNVVRIKASSVTPKKAKKAVEAEIVTPAASADKEPKAKKVKKAKGGKKNFFAAIGGYFKGAWVELRQVRWPTRRATWGLTGAVLIYTAFFVVLILLLDAAFKYLFELILGQ